MLLVASVLISLTWSQGASAFVKQISEDPENIRLSDDDNRLQTWFNRRLHTLNVWTHRNGAEDLSIDKWYTLEPYFNGPAFNSSEELDIYFSWNVGRRLAYTYMDFVNEPLGKETVNLRITTNMFDLENATKPLNDSVNFVKFTFWFNATHIHLWVNDILAVKLFLRDIPLDIGDVKWFRLVNTTSNDFARLYYFDPTVFCWDDCFEDDLPNKFHFDRDLIADGKYTADQLGECKIVNCTAEMLDKSENPSPHARCVRLYHTAQGQSNQRVKLVCTNEDYTYTACQQYPNKPCWYEVCDNYDLCNSSPTLTPLRLLLLLLSLLVTSH